MFSTPTMLRAVLLVCALSVARGCDVCVAGVCQRRGDLVRGFAVTDQMALDCDRRVLYVQLDHLSTTALHLHDLRIERVQRLDTSGLTVDQATGALYTARDTTLYRYSPGDGSLEVASNDSLEKEPDLMFHKDNLYYTTKCCRGLRVIKNGTSRNLILFSYRYAITDFVVNKNNIIYFVSYDKLYKYDYEGENDFYSSLFPTLIANKSYVLSVDKSGDVYLGDATANGIYKLESDRMVPYAAYSGGSVDRFVFDHQNNIVFHDPVQDTVSYWEPEGTPCAVEPPHDTFIVKDVSNNLCHQTTDKRAIISNRYLPTSYEDDNDI